MKAIVFSEHTTVEVTAADLRTKEANRWLMKWCYLLGLNLSAMLANLYCVVNHNWAHSLLVLLSALGMYTSLKSIERNARKLKPPEELNELLKGRIAQDRKRLR